MIEFDFSYMKPPSAAYNITHEGMYEFSIIQLYRKQNSKGETS